MLISWFMSVILALSYADYIPPLTPVGLHPYHELGFVVRKSRPIPKVDKKSINLSFSDFTLSIENGIFIIDKATQVSSIGEEKKPTIVQGNSISRTLIIKAVEFNFKSRGNVNTSENGIATGYNLKANGPMHIKNIKVVFTGPLKNEGGRWSEMVKMPNCKAKIGVVDITRGYGMVLQSQSAVQREIQDAIRSQIEKHICTILFAVHRYPKIEHRLSQYDSVSLGENYAVNYRPEHVTYRGVKTFEIFLGSKIVRTDAADPLLSQKRPSVYYKSYSRCVSSKTSDLSIWVNQLFFEAMLKQIVDNKSEYTDKDFKTKPLKWFKYLVALSDEYAKKFNGSLIYRIGLVSLPQWSCEQEKCNVSMQTSAELLYRPLAQREVEVLKFKTNFDAEFEIHATAVTQVLPRIVPYPDFPRSLPSKGNYIRLYGNVRSFKLTENKVATATNYMHKGSFKSGEEKHFDKDAFQKEIGETIFKEILSKGVDVVYPLHKKNGLVNLKFEKDTQENKVAFCFSADYSKNPDLWPIAFIRQN